MKHKKNLLALFALLVLLLPGCKNTTLPDLSKAEIVYDVTIPQFDNGSIRVSRATAPSGTHIDIYINPDPGYRLKSLWYYVGDSGNDLIQEKPYYFPMPSNHVRIVAAFEPVPAGTYTVSFEDTPKGIINASLQSGVAGTEVNVSGTPDSGYVVRKVTVKNAATGATVEEDVSLPYSFNLPAFHVKVGVVFDQARDTQELLASGRAALQTGEYDLAYEYYEAAYRADSTNPEAVVYSSLGKLGNILANSQSRRVLSKFGMSLIPSTLKAWICDELYLEGKDPDKFRWYMEYNADVFDGSTRDRGYYTKNAYLPRLSTPAGYPNGFLNFNIVHNGSNDIIEDGQNKKIQYRRYWDSLLFWNLISSNRTGFNDLLSDTLTYIFGPEFDAVAARITSLSYDDEVDLSERLKTRFELDGVFVGDKIGRAELELVIAYARGIKAVVEYLAAYNWEMDLSPMLLPNVGDDDALNEILSTLFTVMDKRISDEGSSLILTRFLPLKTFFMKPRNDGMVAASRTEFLNAVKLARTALAHSTAQAHLNSEAPWLNGALTQFDNALTSGGEVFIPASLDELTAWPASTGGAKYGIKTGAFFTPGVFSPEKLVTTTSGGSRFKFFGLNADFSTGTPITGPDQFDQRAHPEFKGFTFEVKTGYLRNIFSKGFGVEMSGETALFHKVFQEIYLWQPYPGVEKPTYFKPAVGEKLYDYYYQQ